ncbi:MAG: amino acid racemase [Candidatus Liptonbacteria bacterium]|nr:amino acid racemase [Candidatus Liptonbacteria bacterium]
MKTLGILGGVGPQTTSKVYLSVIKMIREAGGEKYPPIAIYNLPFPFAVEHEAIIQGISAEKMIPYLVDGAKILEKSGADFGILPCNTLHKFMPEIRKAVKLPFLSILEETASVLKDKNVKKVGILATETTIKSKIYENASKSNGIDILYPSETEQNIVNNMIVELLNGKETSFQKEKLTAICAALHERRAEIILLACTDLQLVASEIKTPVPVVDTTEILINASVREMTK